MPKSFTETELLELIADEAQQFLTDAKDATQDELPELEKEIDQWLIDLKDNLPSPLYERAQQSKETAEMALAKVKRRKPKPRDWKGAEIQAPPPPPPPPPPPQSEMEPPTPPKSSEENGPKITKV